MTITSKRFLIEDQPSPRELADRKRADRVAAVAAGSKLLAAKRKPKPWRKARKAPADELSARKRRFGASSYSMGAARADEHREGYRRRS